MQTEAQSSRATNPRRASCKEFVQPESKVGEQKHSQVTVQEFKQGLSVILGSKKQFPQATGTRDKQQKVQQAEQLVPTDNFWAAMALKWNCIMDRNILNMQEALQISVLLCAQSYNTIRRVLTPHLLLPPDNWNVPQPCQPLATDFWAPFEVAISPGILNSLISYSSQSELAITQLQKG